ncbi:dispanin subfamily A member 2b-like [Clarias gariepinus]|uniref:dispanin subfamily A member 2b-like n=1 Tax=Clarias gariepinus TaxID=13013 RepID=UPI00234D4989|nr:dispanin subfamily A member 2b-like [Clarias gariepinus]XP_053347063.1 dispanin subfamily A member 2b-like [Clarias gariepinus]
MQSPMVPLNVPLSDGRGAGTVVVSMPEHPPDYTVWSIATFFYGNPCCLGLVALIFSMKSRDQKMVGDMIGGKSYGSKARLFNIIALVLFAIFIILFIVIMVKTVSAVSSISNYYSRGRTYGNY